MTDPDREEFRAVVRELFELIDERHGDDALPVKHTLVDLFEATVRKRIGMDESKTFGEQLINGGDWRAVRAYLDALPQ